MASKLKKLQDIDNRIKCTVCGYVREHQSMIESQEYNLFNNIPILIPSICTLYYDPNDYFIANKKVKLSKDRKTILGLDQGFRL